MAARGTDALGKIASFLKAIGVLWVLGTLAIAVSGLADEGAFDGTLDAGRMLEAAIAVLPGLIPGLFLIWLAGRLRRMDARRVAALTGVAKMLAQRATAAAERNDPASRRGVSSHGTPSEIVSTSDTPMVSNARSRTRRSVIQR